MKMSERSYHGSIWIVKEDMIANSDINNCIKGRKVLIEKGELIEFRFHSGMNFRTLDHCYYWVSKEVWHKHCFEVAHIFEKVVSRNCANLKEIKELELFDWVTNGKQVYDTIIDDVNTEKAKSN